MLVNEAPLCYTINQDSDEPIMLIDRHIGFDEIDGFGIMGDVFQRELLMLDGLDKKRIQVWINSPGGVVSDGYSIYNAILKSKTKVDTYNFGIAASIAAVIFQAGRKRYMADYSKLMYHNPFGGEDDKGLDAIRDSIATMISSRTGKTADEVKRIMNKTTWIGSAEAMEMGFCDEIEASKDFNKKREMNSSEEIKNAWQDFGLIMNKLLPDKPAQTPTNKITMKQVCNKLSLVPEATEESIVAAIDKLEARATSAEGALNKKGDDLKTKEEELDALSKKCKALEDEIKQMKDAKNAADAEKAASDKKDKEEKAKNLIKGFVADGRIKNEAAIIAKWETKAVENYDDTKALIEDLPLNREAPKMNVVTGGGDTKGRLTGVVANKMASLLAKQEGK